MTVWCRAKLGYAGAGGAALSAAGVDVDIYDGRQELLPGWQECGFQILDRPSVVEDWSDDDEIASRHYPEAEALCRTLTGCDFALVSDHVRRTAEATRPARDQVPVRLVHSDFAPGYDAVVRSQYLQVKGRGAAALARSGVTAEQIMGAGRVVMMQLWRNVGPPRMDYPVAWCDCRTVSPDEGRPFRYTGYVAGGRSFDALAIVAPEPPDRHRWYAFPDMTSAEVVAFRTYDTELVDAGATFFTPHSAFRDPAVDADAAPRRSVELRVMCVFL
ncbi:MAG TPA: CmcJ/NvfI family oxidoreductase [Acidimicrobiales bacterium]|nr:CmcJ/NvfI family oxidoreductase [Acidimicrobiales bacterium]